MVFAGRRNEPLDFVARTIAFDGGAALWLADAVRSDTSIMPHRAYRRRVARHSPEIRLREHDLLFAPQ